MIIKQAYSLYFNLPRQVPVRYNGNTTIEARTSFEKILKYYSHIDLIYLN